MGHSVGGVAESEHIAPPPSALFVVWGNQVYEVCG